MTGPTRTKRDVDTATSSPANVLVVGGGALGKGIAASLAAGEAAVTFVDEDAGEGTDGVATLSRRVTDAAGLGAVREAVGDVDAVVAAGPDSRALLVGHLSQLELDDATVVAVVDDPWRRRAFDGLDVEPVVAAEVLADAVRERLPATVWA